MNINEHSQIIENSWNNDKHIDAEVTSSVLWTISALSEGVIRVAEKIENEWRINEWIKKAILISFKLKGCQALNTEGVPLRWFDKLESKFLDWDANKFTQCKIRVCPPAHVREGAFIGENTVLMPSFVNIGAYVGNNCMIDTWATVGACAQIGDGVHISGGTGIGGVLEPLGKRPVIIEDGCFIGARSEIAEGVLVESGAVISMGVFIGASTKIVDRATGEIFIGRIPRNAVVVPGTLDSGRETSNGQKISMYCAIIAKYADDQTRSKTALNQDLRKHNHIKK